MYLLDSTLHFLFLNMYLYTIVPKSYYETSNKIYWRPTHPYLRIQHIYISVNIIVVFLSINVIYIIINKHLNYPSISFTF